jgi:hypothetical protein
MQNRRRDVAAEVKGRYFFAGRLILDAGSLLIANHVKCEHYRQRWNSDRIAIVYLFFV